MSSISKAGIFIDVKQLLTFTDQMNKAMSHADREDYGRMLIRLNAEMVANFTLAYHRRDEKHYLNGQKGAGLVAQEVQSVLPFAVTHETDYLALNYNVFHAYEIGALQNHEERIKQLEAKVAELESKLNLS